jgi:hypothetical protein
MFMMCLHTKFEMPAFGGVLVIAIKPLIKYSFLCSHQEFSNVSYMFLVLLPAILSRPLQRLCQHHIHIHIITSFGN